MNSVFSYQSGIFWALKTCVLEYNAKRVWLMEKYKYQKAVFIIKKTG